MKQEVGEKVFSPTFLDVYQSMFFSFDYATIKADRSLHKLIV